jgi:very-long-chain enoyl-CoA reductase
MQITVNAGKGDRAKTTKITLDSKATVLDLKKEYNKAAKKNIHRQSYKCEIGDKTIRLDDDSKTVASYGLGENPVLTMKDLGPQIGYRTVFLWEYFGPMVFVGLYYMRPSLIYGKDASADYNWVALLGVACWMLHFLKREFETIFVHKFSRPTMPLGNLFKNCMYYWSFGAVIGYPLCNPAYVPPGETQVYVGLGIFLLCELGNLICHVMLSNMRPAEGSQARSIPSGFLFNYVACPNYTFEVMSWVGFSIMTQVRTLQFCLMYSVSQLTNRISLSLSHRFHSRTCSRWWAFCRWRAGP